jgi:integrase
MPRRKTLTDRTVQSLKAAPPGKRLEIMDAVVPHLALRITDSGHKSYVLISRFPGSEHPTRRALGGVELTLAQARAKARAWLEFIGRGIDPREQEERERAAEQRKRANSFAAFCQDFIEQKLPAERKGVNAEADLRRVLIPAWGNRPITDITADDVKVLIRQIKHHPAQAHNIVALGRRMYNWAIDLGDFGLTSSPFDRIRPKVLIGPRRMRSRVLSDVELRALWRAAGKLEYPYEHVVKLLLVTAQRKAEVGQARWSEFDLTKKLWTIGGERTKNAIAHEVPLSSMALEILETIPRFESGDYLFSADFGVNPVNGFSRAKERLDREMLAELKAEGIDTLRPFVLHDLRRSARTGFGALPVPDNIKELVINHAPSSLHRTYDLHSYRAEKKKCLDLWAKHLRDVVTPPPANVTRLRRVR